MTGMSKSDRRKVFENYINVFDALKKRNSILLTLFNPGLKNVEILNIGAQAPPPSKDYCNLVLTHDKLVYRWWKISMRGDSENRYPGEIKDSYEDLIYDDHLQREILRVFGEHTFTYVMNIVEKGHLDYLSRLPEKVLMKIVSNLEIEDISRLSQVSSFFRQLCHSDMLWMELYKKNYSTEITKELYKLAERDGWRRLFFTNKIKLQLELRRQAKNEKSDELILTSRSNNSKEKRVVRSAGRKPINNEDSQIDKQKYKSTFITEH